MPDDILDAAQKAIDDAAKQAGSPPSPKPSSAGTPPSTATDQPSAPQPPVPQTDSENPPATLPPTEPAPTLPPEPYPEPAVKPEEPPPPPSEDETAQGEKLISQLIGTPTVPPSSESQKPPPPPEPAKEPPLPPTKPSPEGKKPKTMSKGVLLTVVFFLFITIPLSVFYVAQQRKLAELRSQAYVPEPCKVCEGKKCATVARPPSCSSSLNECDDDGDCGGTPPPPPPKPTDEPCRWECMPKFDCLDSAIGGGIGKIETGKCNIPQTVCCRKPSVTIAPKPTATPTNPCVQRNCYERFDHTEGGKCVGDKWCYTEVWDYYCDKPAGVAKCNNCGWAGPAGNEPGKCIVKFIKKEQCQTSKKCKEEPTPTPVPQCRNIKIYKGTQQVNPTTLKPGDQVKLAVKGDGNPTRARFRVNGSAWSATTTTNAQREFVLDFTIPSGVTNFVIEAEVYVGGAWR